MSVVALVLALVAPGAAVVAWGPRGTWAARLGLALALAPLVGGALVAGLALAHVAWVTAFWAVTLGGVLVAAAGVARARARAHARGGGEGAGPRAAWIAAAIGGAILGLMYGLSEWWRLDSDAWTHEPIVRTLRDHGAPPLDPWYAGFHLQYAWIYHAWVAAVGAASGVGPFDMMSVLAVVSFVAFALVAGDLLARLHGPRTGAALAFLLLGLNGAFLLTVPLIALQALVGRTAGVDVLVRSFAGAGVDADRTAALLRWFGTQTWFGNKFAGATPLSLGLAALVAWLDALERRVAGVRAERGTALAVGAAAGAAALAHPVLLLFVVATSACAVVLAAVGPAPARRESLAFAARVAWPTLLGALPAALFFAFLLSPSAGHVTPPVDLSAAKLLGLALCTLPALALAPPVLRAWFAGPPPRRVLAALCVGALAFTLLLRLPGSWPFFTVDKTSYLLWIPWSLAAGGAWAAWLARARRSVRGLAIALVLLPATGLSLTARWFDPHAAVRQPWNRPALVALRAALPKDALLVVPPGDIDMPVFLARDAYDEDKADGIVRGYNPVELAARHALVDTLMRAGRLDPALVARVQATGRPAYAVWPAQDAPWSTQTPGASLRRFVARGETPPWGAALPSVHLAGFGAIAPFPGTPALRIAPGAGARP